MNNWSALPFWTTLVSPAAMYTPASAAARAHGLDDTLKNFERQSFFNHESAGERNRFRASHRQVVDRAAHRQPANIAAGEEERRDHVRIGGERQPFPADRQHR